MQYHGCTGSEKETEHHETEMAAASYQTRQACRHNVVYKIKHQHVNQIDSVADISKELQYWPVDQRFPWRRPY